MSAPLQDWSNNHPWRCISSEYVALAPGVGMAFGVAEWDAPERDRLEWTTGFIRAAALNE